MDSLSFYESNSKSCRMVTLQETMDSLQANNKGGTVYILPPESGDRNIPSDEEQCDEHEDELFEPAGELEISFSSSSDDEDQLQVETRHNAFRWRKKYFIYETYFFRTNGVQYQ